MPKLDKLLISQDAVLQSLDKRQIYIYCPSYPSLTLVVYFKEKIEGRITIISGNQDVIQFCEVIGLPVHIYREPQINKPRIRDLFNYFKFLRFRQELRQSFQDLIRELDSGIFFYTIPGIDYAGIALTDFISKQKSLDLTVIYWREFREVYLLKVSPKSIKELLTLLLVKFSYGEHYEYKQTPDGRYLYVADNFRQKRGIIELDLPIEEISTEGQLLDLRSRLGILPSGPLYIALGTNKREVIDLLWDCDHEYSLWRLIIQTLGNELVLKPHPGNSVSPSVFSGLRCLPSFLPVEYCCGKGDVVIGVCSSSMPSLAKRGVLVISLLDLIKPTPAFDRNGWRSKLAEDSGNKILFVGSIETAIRRIKEV